MPLSNEDARLELKRLIKDADVDGAWVARRLGVDYQWVARRLNGRTRMLIDDYGRIKVALTPFENSKQLVLQ